MNTSETYWSSNIEMYCFFYINIYIINVLDRDLQIRLKEHQHDIQIQKSLSQIFQHTRNNQHEFDFSNMRILHK